MNYGYANQQPMKRCPQCKGTVLLQETQCPGCGHVFRTQFAPELNKTQVILPSTQNPWETSAFLASILTLLYPGIGQAYNRQYMKGLAVAGGYTVFMLLSEIPVGIRLFLSLIMVTVLIVDAALICRKRKFQDPITQWEWF